MNENVFAVTLVYFLIKNVFLLLAAPLTHLILQAET